MGPKEVNIGQQIHQPEFKANGAGTYFAEFDGLPAVVKRGDARALSREQDILDQVNSTRIPDVLDFQSDGSQAQLVIERLPGEGLDKMIGLDGDWNSNPVPLTDAKQIVGGLGECFKRVKQAGFLYRDLNFGHILVDKTNRNKVCLVDLEASIPANEHGGIIESEQGTWETMAPEEFTLGETMTEASNTYTMGVVLLQLVGGKNPFHIDGDLIPDIDGRRQATRFLHSKGIDYFPMHDKPVGKLLKKALHPDPSQRFATIKDFQNALNEL